MESFKIVGPADFHLFGQQCQKITHFSLVCGKMLVVFHSHSPRNLDLIYFAQSVIARIKRGKYMESCFPAHSVKSVSLQGAIIYKYICHVDIIYIYIYCSLGSDPTDLTIFHLNPNFSFLILMSDGGGSSSSFPFST